MNARRTRKEAHQEDQAASRPGGAPYAPLVIVHIGPCHCCMHVQYEFHLAYVLRMRSRLSPSRKEPQTTKKEKRLD